MKPTLRFEELEDRSVPAAGSTLVTVGVGVDYTLSINTYGHFASMQLAAPDWLAWQDGSQTQAQIQAMTQRIYQYFPDQFSNIWFVNNQTVAPPTAAYNGLTTPVKNDTSGIGQPIMDQTAQFGSAGNLQTVIHLIQEDRIRVATSLHEFLHRDAAYLPELQSSVPGHWGFSSVGGHLGGWKPGTLRTLLPGSPTLYDADGPTGSTDWYANSSYTNAVPYSPLELYMLGLIDANQVPDIQYATNGTMVNQAQGWFTADSIQTLTYQNIIAQEGLRMPTPMSSQKNFRELFVVLTPNPMTQAQIDKFDTDIELFGRPSSDGDPTLNNFYEATGGRATMVVGGLDAFIPQHNSILSIGTSGGTMMAFDTNANGQYDTNRPIRPDISTFLAGTLGTDVRTAVGDVDGDNIEDFAVASGPGSQTRFAVVSGDLTHYIIEPTLPFRGSADFDGGAFVSVGDIDGDGRADVIVSPDEGGGPRVTIFSYKPAPTTPGTNPGVFGMSIIADFFGINDANFRGGARTAIGDVNKDGVPDLAVSAGFGGGPRVSLFDGKTFFLNRTHIVGDFYAFPGADATRLRNGVFVAIGDVNADGYGDLVFGGGPGGAPRVSILSGSRILSNGVASAQSLALANFYVAGNTTDRGGVRVAVKNADGDHNMEVVVGSGEDSTSRIRVYNGKYITSAGEPKVYQDIDPFGTILPDGVYVG